MSFLWRRAFVPPRAVDQRIVWGGRGLARIEGCLRSAPTVAAIFYRRCQSILTPPCAQAAASRCRGRRSNEAVDSADTPAFRRIALLESKWLTGCASTAESDSRRARVRCGTGSGSAVPSRARTPTRTSTRSGRASLAEASSGLARILSTKVVVASVPGDAPA